MAYVGGNHVGRACGGGVRRERTGVFGWMVEGCEQWAHPDGTTMHVGVAARRGTHDRVRVSAPPDVPPSEEATPAASYAMGLAEAVPVTMAGAIPTDPGHIPVVGNAAPSATIIVPPATLAAGILDLRATTILMIMAGAVDATGEMGAHRARAVAALAGSTEGIGRSGSGQGSARCVASVRRNVATCGIRNSAVGHPAQAHDPVRPGVADSGMTTPRCMAGALPERAAAIRVGAAWELDVHQIHAIHAIHAHYGADWPLSKRWRRRREWAVARRF